MNLKCYFYHHFIFVIIKYNKEVAWTKLFYEGDLDGEDVLIKVRIMILLLLISSFDGVC